MSERAVKSRRPSPARTVPDMLFNVRTFPEKFANPNFRRRRQRRTRETEKSMQNLGQGDFLERVQRAELYSNSPAFLKATEERAGVRSRWTLGSS